MLGGYYLPRQFLLLCNVSFFFFRVTNQMNLAISSLVSIFRLYRLASPSCPLSSQKQYDKTY